MFGFNKKEDKSTLPKQLQDFLLEADERYMRAFTSKSVKVLGAYFSRDCCIKLSRAIYGESNVRFFGTDKYRETVWTPILTESEKMVLRKTVTFDKIKISKRFKMAIADDYSERWIVSMPHYVVEDVGRID